MHEAGAKDRRTLEAYARFATSLRFEQIPAATVHAAKRCILDQFGCAVFGSTPEWSRILQEFVRGEEAAKQAVVWGTPIRTTASLAALANGMAGHAFEIDDLHTDSTFHPGAVSVPAALAAAELTGKVTGKDFITAVVAGYEVGIRVGIALGIPHFLRGFHPQGTLGVFCAAVSAGKILKLDEEGMVAAMAIAASQGAGLMAAQEGGMVKRFHSGRACQSGVAAAQLAQRGFTGAHNALDASFGGFIESFKGDKVEYDALTAGLGTVWETDRVGFKAYASCATVHTSIDTTRSIMMEHGIKAGDVKQVTAHVTTDAWIHSAFPYTGEDVTSAQMNIPFGVAAYLHDEEVGPRQFTETRIRDPRILATVAKVKVEPDTALDALGKAKRFAAWMEIETTDGRTLTARTEARRGEGKLALDDAELAKKFDSLLSMVPGVDGAKLKAAINHLETMTEMRDLAALLATKG